MLVTDKNQLVGIIIVTYKSHRETVRYVKEELSKITSPHKIAIVNNAGTDELNRALAQELDAELLLPAEVPKCPQKRVFVLAEKENGGYACGNNLGARFLSKNFAVEWFLVTNNDLILEDRNVVETLIEKFEQMPDIGMIGPRVVSPDGADQSPHRQLSVWSQLVVPRLFYPVVFPLLHMGFFKEVIPGAAEGRYYRIMGSFFLLRGEAFERAGGFDENTFLYAEEQILAERMKSVGFGVYYLPTKRVIHNHGQTISANFDQRTALDINFRSLLHYYRNYRNTSHWTCKLARFAHWVYSTFYNPILAGVRPVLRQGKQP